MNGYPQTLDDLVETPADATNPDKWGGPYLEKRVPLDPWDNEYMYANPGKNNTTKFDVWSMGADGMDGSEDDIGNWEQ